MNPQLYDPHHESYMSLRTSKVLGCIICRRLYFHLLEAAAAKKLSLQEALTKPPVTIAALGLYEINIRSAVELEAADFNLKFCSNQMRIDPSKYEFHEMVARAQFAETDKAVPSFVSRDHLPTPIFSGDSWKLAGRWLTECQTGHKRCSNPAFGQEMFMPSRLLEIKGSSDDFEVRLIEQADRDKRVPYITLSYCWGQSRFYVLNSSTRPELLAGVCSARLPKLFQDVFVVVKKLGVERVWIDSLCILQDSNDDWRAQSAQMHRIYSSSVCTIAASGSFSSEETLFSCRDPELLEPFEERMNFLSCRDTYLFVDARFWKDSVERSPLSKRAWAFQERLLSPRVLHFGKKQIFWECAELEACEIFPQGIGGVMLGRASEYKSLDLEHYDYFGSSVEASAKTLWRHLVEMYTHCQLTRKQDKLAAFSGIAKYIQSLLGGEQYLAGLWRKELHFQLLWRVERHGQSSGGLCESEYRAPSWSWASHDVPLANQTHSKGWVLENPPITILDAKVEPVCSDVTGQVSNGFIRLTGGPLLTGHFKTHIVEKYSRILERDPWTFWFDNRPASQTFCYLSVAVRFVEKASDFSIEGLVLVQVPGEKGKYRRCGIFILVIPNPYTSDANMCDELQKLAKDMLQETLDYKTPTDLFEDDSNSVICLV